MEESERGRLYPMKADGSEMAPFIIKKDVLYIGSGDSCGIRIYTEGIYPEHCALTIGKKGRVYVQPLHSNALALVNQDKITKKCLLKHNDVITILVKSFRFTYPTNSMLSQISIKTPIVPSRTIKTCSPKRKISSGRKSATPTGMDAEQNKQKKKKLSICEKRVRFGPKLTPEEFDKHLPPSSPLRRGSLPGKTHSPNTLKQRLSFQLSPNILKRKKVSVNAKCLSSESKRSFPLQSVKMARGSPLVDKSLNIANESNTTFTVNVEVHSGPKSKIETPMKSMPFHNKSSSIESGDLCGTAPHSVSVDEITKVDESLVSKTTPLKFDKSSAKLKIHRDVCDMSCTSLPVDDITKISQSPILKKIAFKCDKNITPDSSTMDKLPLFSDVLKKINDHYDKVSTVSQAKSSKLSTCLKKASKNLGDTQKYSEKFINRHILAVGSTGHANSPETIILRKRKITDVDNISDVINVRRSPRTPRRAKYNTMTIREKSNEIEEFCHVASLKKVPDESVKQDGKATSTQPRISNKFENKIVENQDSQLKDMCSIETEEIGRSAVAILPQQSNITVEQVKNKVVEKITTPSRKSRKTQEFVPDAFSNLPFEEKSKENEDVQLELCTDFLFQQFHEEEVKQDTKATPNQQKKGRKSREGYIEKQDSQLDNACNIETIRTSTECKNLQCEFSSVALFEKVQKELEKHEVIVSPTQSRSSRIFRNEIIEKQDSQSDDLDNIETGGIFKKAEDMQPEFCGVAVSNNFEDDVVNQNIKITPTQLKKVQKSETEIIKKQDSPSCDLHNAEISRYSENEADSKAPKDEDVKEIKKKVNKPRRGRKQLQVPIEDKDKDLEDSIKPEKTSKSSSDPIPPAIFSIIIENEAVNDTKKTTKKTRKGRTLLQVPQENKDKKLDDLTTQKDYSKNTTDSTSHLMDSPNNEKENESLKLEIKKPVKRSRNKRVAKVLNENEEIELKEDLIDENSKKAVDLNSRNSDDVSVLRTTQEVVKTNIKNMDKPLPKRRKLKKDCSAGEELKSIVPKVSLSPCRRVTRSMVKKCAPK